MSVLPILCRWLYILRKLLEFTANIAYESHAGMTVGHFTVQCLLPLGSFLPCLFGGKI